MKYLPKPKLTTKIKIKWNRIPRLLRRLLAVLLIITIGIPAYLFNPFTPRAKAAWFDENWAYRQKITVTVPSNSSNYTNVQTLLIVSTSTLISSKLQSSCQDLRFTNTNGVSLPYYISSGCNTTTTRVWVIVDLVPKNTTSYTLYMYYGNPSAAAASNSQPFNLTSSLVGYYAMSESSWTNDCSTATVLDYSTNAYTHTSCPNGTGPTTAAGLYGNAGSFDGSNDYTDSGSNNPIATGDSVTFGGWVQPGSTGNGYVFSRGADGSGNGWSIFLLAIGGSAASAAVVTTSGGAAQYTATGTTTLTAGTWYHIMGVWTAGVGISIFVNGTSEATTATATTSLRTSTVNIRFGSINGNLFYKGLIDDFRIYNRALSSTEVTQTYNGSAAPSTSFATEEIGTGPTLYWRFDDATGTTAQDSTINNLDGASPGMSNGAGTGADGAITISSTTNINTTNSIAGRSCGDGGDAVNYSVTENRSGGTNQIVLSATPSSGCLAANDEVLIINLSGTNAGLFEFRTISSISTATLTFTSPLTNGYDGSSDKIMVQRVPNYTNVTVNSSTIFSGTSYNGTIGGVFAFRASGTVSNSGTIRMNGAGGSGGSGGSAGSGGNNNSDGTNGGSGTAGTGSGAGNAGSGTSTKGTSGAASLRGGGGAGSGGGGAGGNFGAAATAGTAGVGGGSGGGATNAGSGGSGGTAGSAVGSADFSSSGGSLYLGSGGGGGAGGGGGGGGNGGCNGNGGAGTAGAAGGAGGGIVAIFAATLTNSSTISANGSDGTGTTTAGGGGASGACVGANFGGGGGGAPSGGGGGGSGGAVWIAATTITFGTITATSGSGGNSNAIAGVGGHCGNDAAAGGGGGGSGGTDGSGGSGGSLGCSTGGSSGTGSTSGSDGGAGSTGRLKCDNTSGNCSGGNPSVGSSEVITSSSFPTWQTEDMCVISKCLYFNGLNFVMKADDSRLDFVASDSFTVSAWSKRNGASSANNFILTKAQSGYTGYKLYQDASGDYCFDVSDGTNTDTACTSAVEFDDNQWHLVQGVKIGTTSITLYVDGKQRAQDASIAATGTLANSGSLNVGIDLDGSSNGWLGFLDDVKVYSYARSLAQIQTDFVNRGNSDGSGQVLGSKIENNPAALADGLVGYWKEDETTNGATATDSSGNATSLTDTATVVRTGGKFANAGDFESGSSQYQYAADNAVLSITGSTSLAAWIKPESVTASTLFDITGKWDGANESYLMAQFGDEIRCYIDSVSNYATTDAANLAAGTWYNVACAYNAASATVTIYVNGAISASTVTGTIPSSIGDDAGRFHMGAEDSTTTAANFYDGVIDDIRVYSRVLSSADISALYNFGPGPVGYWNFEERTGTTANDRSGNANTGTITPGTGSVTVNIDPTDDRYFPNDGSQQSAATTVNVNPVFQTNDNRGALYFSLSTIPAGVTVTSASLQYNVTQISGTRQWNHYGYDTPSGDGDPTNADAANTKWDKVDNGTNYVNQSISATGSVSFSLGATAASDIQGNISSPGTFAIGIRDNDESGGADGNFESLENSGTDPATLTVVYSGLAGNWINGKFGSGYSFDAASTNINAGSGSTLDDVPAGGVSLEAWIYPKSQGENSAGVVMTKNSGTSPSSGWLFQFAGTNALKFTVDGSTDLVRTSSNSVVTANAWNHVALTWDGVITTASSARIYVNGVEVTYQTTTDGASRVSDAAQSLIIGNDSTSADTFDGFIDEAKVYNYARTPGQVVQDMNAGHPAPGSPVGSPAGYWKMDEGYGTTAYDSGSQALLGSANNLTLSSASSWTDSGKFSKAWNGTGANWLSRADDADFDFAAADDLSISMWFKSDSASNPGAIEYLIDKESSSAGYAVYANTDGTVCFGIDDDATWTPDDSACTTTDIYDAAWHYITATKTGTSRIDLYVDGRPTASDTSIAATATLANADSLVVGDRDATNNGDEFTGDLDEIKIFRLVLTAAQVKVDYNRGSTQVLGALGDSSTYQVQAANQEYCVVGDATSCAAPVGRWNFEEGTGTSAIDISGNGNTGTLGASTAAPSWNPGKVGKALKYDGSDDYVSAPIDLSGTNNITVEFWLYWDTFANNDKLAMEYTANYNTVAGGFLIDPNSNSAGGSGKFEFGTSAGDSTNYNTAAFTRPSGAAWHHYALMMDKSLASAEAKTAYVDGVAQTLTQVTNANTTGNFANSTLYFMSRAGSSLFGAGMMDELKVYNYTRSAAQVIAEYNRGAPTGYWKLDECQGSIAYDSSINASGATNGTTGTITIGASGGNTALGTCTTPTDGTGAWYDGRIGKYNYSLQFDGTDDQIDMGTSFGNYAKTDNFAVSAWINATAIDSANHGIVSRDNASSVGWHMRIASNNKLRFLLSSDGSNYTGNDSTASLTTGWHHVVGTWDGSSPKTYIDGKDAGTNAVNAGSLGTITGTINFYVGRDPSSTSYFSGQIDDVKVYNYTLTANQVRLLYNQGSAVRFGPNTGAP